MVQIDLVKSQKEVVRIVRKGKNDGKRKKMTIAGEIQRLRSKVDGPKG